MQEAFKLFFRPQTRKISGEEAEAGPGHSLRKEKNALAKFLTTMCMNCDISDSADSQFEAAADQLNFVFHNSNVPQTASSVRNVAVAWLRVHGEASFLPFNASDNDRDQTFTFRSWVESYEGCSWDEYLSRISVPSGRGDFVTLRAIAESFEVLIVVFARDLTGKFAFHRIQPSLGKKVLKKTIHFGITLNVYHSLLSVEEQRKRLKSKLATLLSLLAPCKDESMFVTTLYRIIVEDNRLRDDKRWRFTLGRLWKLYESAPASEKISVFRPLLEKCWIRQTNVCVSNVALDGLFDCPHTFTDLLQHVAKLPANSLSPESQESWRRLIECYRNAQSDVDLLRQATSFSSSIKAEAPDLAYISQVFVVHAMIQLRQYGSAGVRLRQLRMPGTKFDRAILDAIGALFDLGSSPTRLLHSVKGLYEACEFQEAWDYAQIAVTCKRQNGSLISSQGLDALRWLGLASMRLKKTSLAVESFKECIDILAALSDLSSSRAATAHADLSCCLASLSVSNDETASFDAFLTSIRLWRQLRLFDEACKAALQYANELQKRGRKSDILKALAEVDSLEASLEVRNAVQSFKQSLVVGSSGSSSSNNNNNTERALADFLSVGAGQSKAPMQSFDMIQSVLQRGKNQIKSQNYAQAVDTLEQAVAMMKFYKADDAVLLEALCLLCFCFAQVKNYAAGLEWAEKAVRLVGDKIGIDRISPDSKSQIFHFYGACLLRAQRFEEAAEALTFSKMLMESKLGLVGSPSYVLLLDELASALNYKDAKRIDELFELGKAHSSKDRFADCFEAFHECIAIHRANQSCFSKRYAVLLNYTSFCLVKLGRHEEAVSFYDEAVALATMRGSSQHGTFGRALHNFGFAYFEMGKIDKAISILQDSVGILELLDLDWSPTLHLFVVALFKLNRYKDALAFGQKFLHFFSGAEIKRREVQKIVEECRSQLKKTAASNDNEPFDISSLMANSELIGRGGFGSVYKSAIKGVTVALKVLPVEAEAGNHFDDEMRALVLLKHANVIGLLGYSVAPPVLLLEYAAYKSLDRILSNAQLSSAWSVPICVNFCHQIARGVEYLHQCRVIHRDVKAPNVLVATGLVLKLCDFGLARTRLATTATRATQVTRGFVGTLSHCAPESFGGQYSERTDVYAAAVTFWEVFARRQPFEGADSPAALMQQIISGVRPDVSVFDSCRGLSTIVARSWDGEARKRLSSSELAQELQRLSSQNECTVRMAQEFEQKLN